MNTEDQGFQRDSRGHN